MLHKEKDTPAIGTMILLLVILNVIILRHAYTRDESWYRALFITMPLLVLALMNTNFWIPGNRKGLKHD